MVKAQHQANVWDLLTVNCESIIKGKSNTISRTSPFWRLLSCTWWSCPFALFYYPSGYFFSSFCVWSSSMSLLVAWGGTCSSVRLHRMEHPFMWLQEVLLCFPAQSQEHGRYNKRLLWGTRGAFCSGTGTHSPAPFSSITNGQRVSELAGLPLVPQFLHRS